MEKSMLELNNRFEFRGQSIAWGSIGQGEPLILVHGFPWSSQCWRHIAPWLAKRRKVFYFDMLGCGQSEKNNTQDIQAPVQSDLLAALIKHWALDKPTVVGHDFGGLAVLRGHFINKIEYSGLILIDAVAVLPSGSPFYQQVAKYEMAFAGLPQYAHKALFQAYIQRAAHNPLSEKAREIYLQPYSGDNGQAAFYRQIAQSDSIHIQEVEVLYQSMECDVHLIWGQHDSFIPFEQGQQLSNLIGAKSLTVIPDAAHIVHEDAPEAIVGALMSILN